MRSSGGATLSPLCGDFWHGVSQMPRRTPKPESEQSIPEMVDELTRQEIATWYKDGKLTHAYEVCVGDQGDIMVRTSLRANTSLAPFPGLQALRQVNPPLLLLHHAQKTVKCRIDAGAAASKRHVERCKTFLRCLVPAPEAPDQREKSKIKPFQITRRKNGG